MIEAAVQKYSEELRRLGIEHEIIEHPDLRTPVGVQGHLGLTLADGLSTMIMKADDRFAAVIRRDDTRLNFGKVRKILGAKNVRMAKPDEFIKVTEAPLGAARVYNPGLETILDTKLFEKEFLTGGTGSFTCSFRYKSLDLKKIPTSSVADITQ